MPLQSVLAKARGMSTKKKVLLGVGGAAALGLGAFGLSRLLKRKGVGPTAKRGSVSRLRTRVERLMLKIKLKQLTRKLFKEQLRF